VQGPPGPSGGNGLTGHGLEDLVIVYHTQTFFQWDAQPYTNKAACPLDHPVPVSGGYNIFPRANVDFFRVWADGPGSDRWRVTVGGVHFAKGHSSFKVGVTVYCAPAAAPVVQQVPLPRR
jgi:hypothetical protein